MKRLRNHWIPFDRDLLKGQKITPIPLNGPSSLISKHRHPSTRLSMKTPKINSAEKFLPLQSVFRKQKTNKNKPGWEKYGCIDQPNLSIGNLQFRFWVNGCEPVLVQRYLLFWCKSGIQTQQRGKMKVKDRFNRFNVIDAVHVRNPRRSWPPRQTRTVALATSTG